MRTFTAVRIRTKFLGLARGFDKTQVIRCGHNHHTATAAEHCGRKTRPFYTPLGIMGSDGQPATLADFKTKAH